MSAVLEQPKPEVFKPVSYYDTRTVSVNAPRWVWFPGDLIVPERKAEISWLQVGGEETPSPCLQRYGRGFVPRGRAAILELGGEPIPMRHLGELQSVAWQGIALDEQAVKNRFGFVPVFPGDGLRVLKRYSMNPIRKGLDELTVLAGKSWDECHDQDGTGILDFIETAMFGDGMEPTLRGLEEQIRHANLPDFRIDSGKYKSECLKMCDDYRNWGMRMITIEHGLLKTGHIGEWQGGWSYSYSPITEMLMAQLEVTRQDQPMHEMSKLIAQIIPQPAQSAGLSAADMELFERKLEEKLTAVRAADAGRIAELEMRLAEERAKTVEIARSADDSLLIESLLAKDKAQRANVPRETFVCDGCGQECASKAGKLAHERHCQAMTTEE